MVIDNDRYQKIKLFLSDVDGVLTDSGMYYSESGDELKQFSTLDGGGFILLKLAGIQTGFLTSENTELVSRRAQKLKVDHLIQGAKNKHNHFQKLMSSLNLTSDEVAYIGDDINDIPILQTAGVSATVPGLCLPSYFKVDYVKKRAGGAGAVRDFAEWLLKKRGAYEQALSAYLKQTKF